MTGKVRAVAVSVVTIVSLTGCGAAQKVLGIHKAAPTANEVSAPLTAAQANVVLAGVFTAAHEADTKTGAAAKAAVETAYSGEGLRRAIAQVKLAEALPAVGASVPAKPQPKLLAISRGPGYPRVIVAQSVPSPGGLPILHLLTCPDAATPYRISASVTMLPLSTVKPFNALNQGSPLAKAPTAMLDGYAAGMAFPAKAPAEPTFGADPFSTQVRTQAAGVAKAVAGQATFSQVHKVVPSSVYAVRQASGDDLAFGVLQRTDSFTVKPGQAINTVADKEFVALSGKRLVASSASRTTLEFVVFTVPTSKGKPTLVAASEQLVAGSGS